MEIIKDIISKANYFKSHNQHDEAVFLLEDSLNRFKKTNFDL